MYMEIRALVPEARWWGGDHEAFGWVAKTQTTRNKSRRSFQAASLLRRLELGMAQRTQDELKVIRAYPVGTSLDNFRTTFISRFRKRNNENLIDIVDRLTSRASDRGAERRS